MRSAPALTDELRERRSRSRELTRPTYRRGVRPPTSWDGFFEQAGTGETLAQPLCLVPREVGVHGGSEYCGGVGVHALSTTGSARSEGVGELLGNAQAQLAHAAMLALMHAATLLAPGPPSFMRTPLVPQVAGAASAATGRCESNHRDEVGHRGAT